jgi:predicted dienelactone hydrolase
MNVFSWLSARRVLSIASVFLLGVYSQLRAVGYDPLEVDASFKAQSVELSVHDDIRNRDIPLLVYLPVNLQPEPVVVFSHGLGGSRYGSKFLGQHWAARGYVAVFVQHPGSDESVWRNEPLKDRMGALKEAASPQNLVLRMQDVHVVLDQFSTWDQEKNHPLAGRLDLAKIGMSGHSFGAVTTEALSGETLFLSGRKYTDPRIKAAIVFSPSTPHGLSAEDAFASVKIPWMLMTGTKDLAPIGNADLKSRLGVYPALHSVPKFEVVLHNAEHSVFTDRALPGDREPRNPNHHRVILGLSTSFWDAFLRGDSGALSWLEGKGPRSTLESEDQWQFEPR